MKLEVGKKYVLNNGNIEECTKMYGDDPLSVDDLGFGPFTLGGMKYHQDGRFADCERDDELSVKHECGPLETGTLAELDVNVGDTVECLEWHGSSYTAGVNYTVGGVDNYGFTIDPKEPWGKFRIVYRAAETPTLWRDMTDAEKGALLLAQHEGKVIECRIGDMEWIVSEPVWAEMWAYRVKPAPKVVTVPLMADFKEIGTINLIDGKPDPASIKMEEL